MGSVPAATKKARATDAAETPAPTNHSRLRVRIPSQAKASQLANPQLAMARTTSGHHRKPFVDVDCSELLASKSGTAAESVWSRTLGSRSSSDSEEAPFAMGDALRMDAFDVPVKDTCSNPASDVETRPSRYEEPAKHPRWRRVTRGHLGSRPCGRCDDCRLPLRRVGADDRATRIHRVTRVCNGRFAEWRDRRLPSPRDVRRTASGCRWCLHAA